MCAAAVVVCCSGFRRLGRGGRSSLADFDLAAHAGFIVARNQACHLDGASHRKTHHQLARLACGHGDFHAMAVFVGSTLVGAGRLLHALRVGCDLLRTAQHHFMGGRAFVVHHKADGLA